MGTISVTVSITLDGVLQAPGRPDEDTRNGFAHGGWAQPYVDEVMGAEMAKGMAQDGVLLLGRRSYQGLFAFWPKQTDGNPYTAVLDRTTKYVVSRTLTEPLPWQNSVLLSDVDEVAVLKKQVEGTISVIGSGQLVTALQQRGLVDDYTLLIHPLTLGGGLRLLDGGVPAGFTLVESVPTTKGVIIARYATAA